MQHIKSPSLIIYRCSCSSTELCGIYSFVVKSMTVKRIRPRVEVASVIAAGVFVLPIDRFDDLLDSFDNLMKAKYRQGTGKCIDEALLDHGLSVLSGALEGQSVPFVGRLVIRSFSSDATVSSLAQR